MSNNYALTDTSLIRATKINFILPGTIIKRGIYFPLSVSLLPPLRRKEVLIVTTNDQHFLTQVHPVSDSIQMLLPHMARYWTDEAGLGG